MGFLSIESQRMDDVYIDVIIETVAKNTPRHKKIILELHNIIKVIAFKVLLFNVNHNKVQLFSLRCLCFLSFRQALLASFFLNS